jgi:hypothetical protein
MALIQSNNAKNYVECEIRHDKPPHQTSRYRSTLWKPHRSTISLYTSSIADCVFSYFFSYKDNHHVQDDGISTHTSNLRSAAPKSYTMSTTTLTEKDLESTPININTISPKEKVELIAAETASVTSGTTLGPSTTFTPTKTLIINTKGVSVLRLPCPPSELQISVYDKNRTIAYLSTRAKRSSGNCVLTNAEGREVVGTTYFWGPGRDPVLHLLCGAERKEEDAIKTASKWTSRSQKFVLPDGRSFEWKYKRERGFGSEGKKGTALVMSMQGQRVAALIRNDETRSLGSKSCSAGNGGELVLGALVGGKEGIAEEVVVATCLLMLKKEIDRRRTVQIMMISSAVSA